MKTVALIVSLGSILALAIVFAVRQWTRMSGGDVSIHMWIALGLGVGVSFLLGAGLMALSFHSHARGYDDVVTFEE